MKIFLWLTVSLIMFYLMTLLLNKPIVAINSFIVISLSVFAIDYIFEKQKLL